MKLRNKMNYIIFEITKKIQKKFHQEKIYNKISYGSNLLKVKKKLKIMMFWRKMKMNKIFKIVK